MIAKLANLSLSEGRFSDMFKFGQDTPLLKKPGADDKDMANFRPTTNMNTIGKIVERLTQYQIRRHLKDSPNFGQLQSACRALRSAVTATKEW